MESQIDNKSSEGHACDSHFSEFSNEELLEELARRLTAATEELELLRTTESSTDSKAKPDAKSGHLPDTVEGLLAMVNFGPAPAIDSSEWASPDPFTSPKTLRKKAIVKLARVWTRVALDPSKLRNGEINRRLMERETGIPRNTMRPYLDAGLGLHRAGRLYLDGDPSGVDIRIVEEFFG